ncbi:serine/threonine-protein kinase [Singulisphaera sp. Ch08]|uniref:Serine/threonine-protein kinase n=1 Tax=Singulisphaera sp. Ch08 TaxID=3120278 RepID=A0AAU7CC90_9BACT
MSAERPTIASCPHCRAILLRTQRALIHPTASERDEIERALGTFWFEHTTTRFDGRFHRCPGREPIVFAPEHPRSTDESRNLPGSGHSAYRGPHLDIKTSNIARRFLLIAAFVAGIASSSSAQQGSNTPYQRPSVGKEFVVESHPTQRPARSGRTVDQSVLLTGGTARAGNEPARATFNAAQAPPNGSWQGMELADGRYQILDTLRQASAGVVYLAHDRNLDADVVIEVPAFPPVHNHESKARFMRAVRSGARLVHPHLVRVTEVGTHNDAPFVVAEHRAGGSLKFRRPVGPDGRPTPVAPHSLEQWLPDVSDALDYLHTRNRLYREVSLANILFDENGRASLGGLGMAEAIAEWLGPSSEGTAVSHAWLAGPSPTIAPEIVAGGPADGRADQYALAATVYELLSGHPPFEGQTQAGILEKESSIEPPELCQICPTLSATLSSAVQRGLSRDPRQRFPDCKAFAHSVVSAAREPGLIREPPTEPASVTRTDRSHQSRPLLGLPIINRQGASQASLVILGTVCGFLIVALGLSLRQKRSRSTTANQAVGRPIPESLPLANSAIIDGKSRSLSGATTLEGAENRLPDVRRHTTELAGRPHLNPLPAYLPAKSTGRELVRLPDLDPLMDRPKSRLADNLLPVTSTVPAPATTLPQVLGKGPLPPARRRAS